MFLGTPAFAVPSLDALARLASSGAIEIVSVVTQPDRRGDRGALAAPDVKRRALALALPLRQPIRIDPREVDGLLALGPTALVWAAYGNLIPKRLIEACDGRAVNVHASLLPRWRGAAPIAHAILAGDARTGITLMQGTASLDAGPILAQEATVIGADETAGTLTERLAAIGAAMLERELVRYLAGDLAATPQDHERVTWAPKLTTADGQLDLGQPAEALARRVRAMTPDPGAWTTFRGQRIGVLRVSVTGGQGTAHGTLELRGGVPHVAGGAGWLRLEEVRPAGKRAMRGVDWARGLRDIGADARLSS